MTAIDDLIDRNRLLATSHTAAIGSAPSLGIAIVACMDARIDTSRAFGTAPGEVHIIRNAGGVVTEDTIRSLAISQHALGTREVMVVNHTDCGLAKISEDSFRGLLAEYAGFRPTWAVQAFRDPAESVRESVLRVRQSPFLLHRDAVRGFVFDVDTGLLDEIRTPDPEHLD